MTRNERNIAKTLELARAEGVDVIGAEEFDCGRWIAVAIRLPNGKLWAARLLSFRYRPREMIDALKAKIAARVSEERFPL